MSHLPSSSENSLEENSLSHQESSQQENVQQTGKEVSQTTEPTSAEQPSSDNAPESASVVSPTAESTTGAPEVAEESQQHSAFISRLSSYALVNSTWSSVVSGYNALKDYSPMAKAGLERAEAASQKVYAAAAPVIVDLNEKYKLDEKGVAVLERGEETVGGLVNAAVDMKNKAVSAAVESKELAQNLIEANPRPFNQLLDVTESIVNKILPPGEESKSTEGQDSDESEKQTTGVIARATNLGTDVKERAARQIRGITFRSPQEIAEMTHVVDLIQYAAQYIDIEAQKARIQQAADASKAAIEQARAATESKVSEAIQNAKTAAEHAKERVQPLKDFVDERTADIKDSAQRTTIALVSAIAHATELVRRQVVSHTAGVNLEETRAKLHERLAELIEHTKAYTKSLNETQLKEYVENVRAQSGAALASLVALITSSSTTLQGQLLSWSNTVFARLGFQIVPLQTLSAPKLEQ